MYVGENDAPCPPSEAVLRADIIPSMANYITLLGQDHGVFSYYSGEDYMELLNAELVSDISTDDGYISAEITVANDSGSKEDSPDFSKSLST